MKKLLSFLLIAVLMLSLCSCGNDLGKQTIHDDEHGVTEYNTVDVFDYKDFAKEHNETAKTEGFKNVEDKEFFNKGVAKQLAKNELPQGYHYNTIKVFYDRGAGTWRVEFSTVEEDGNVSKAFNVCIDEKGHTLLTVEL